MLVGIEELGEHFTHLITTSFPLALAMALQSFVTAASNG
jgi:hypothetical protein